MGEISTQHCGEHERRELALRDFAAIERKEATYDFLAFMANKKNAFFNVANGWTGVQPGMKYEYFPPVGTATVKEWAK